MHATFRLCTGLVVALVVISATPAMAIIRVDFPVSRVYQEAKIVTLAEIASTDRLAMTCKIRDTLKGWMLDAPLTVALPADLAGRVKADQPVVFFFHDNRSIVHVADGWYDARRQTAGRWTITGPYDMVKNYPGRTIALCDILKEIKAGRPSIKDAIGHEFVGSLNDRGNLGVRPTSLASTDVDGDKDMDLLVGTAEGARLFVRRGQRFLDATEHWGLAEASGRAGAAGDVNGDGRIDLLIGRLLWQQKDRRFVRSSAKLDLPDDVTWVASTIDRADDDKHADVVVLTRDGKLAVATNPGRDGGAWTVRTTDLWAGKKIAQAAWFSRDWGDDGRLYVMVAHADDIVRYPVGSATAPASDFHRLTGLNVSQSPRFGSVPFRADLCAALDYDGSGRTDFVLLTNSGGVTLANRGYGAMMINAFMHTQFRPLPGQKKWPKIPTIPFELSPAVLVAGGKHAGRTGKGHAQNLFLLRPDGQLFELDNQRK